MTKQSVRWRKDHSQCIRGQKQFQQADGITNLIQFSVTAVMWSFHDNELSMTKPKNFVLLEFIELGATI